MKVQARTFLAPRCDLTTKLRTFWVLCYASSPRCKFQQGMDLDDFETSCVLLSNIRCRLKKKRFSFYTLRGIQLSKMVLTRHFLLVLITKLQWDRGIIDYRTLDKALILCLLSHIMSVEDKSLA